eukprot:7368586-Lingulodinium_polyedra.AAC.1
MARHWEHAAEHWCGGGIATGVDWPHVRGHLRKLEKKGRLDWQGAMTALVVGATWPMQRRVDAGLPVLSLCPRCGKHPETAVHRYWECERNADIDDVAVKSTQHLCSKAVQESEACPALWCRGLLPLQRLQVPPPPQEAIHRWAGDVEEFRQCGQYYLDGSGGAQSAEPQLRRVGWAAVAMRF